jgi:hypothetical protein
MFTSLEENGVCQEKITFGDNSKSKVISVSQCGWPVEALSERVSNQGSRHGMMSIDLTMDIL